MPLVNIADPAVDPVTDIFEIRVADDLFMKFILLCKIKQESSCNLPLVIISIQGIGHLVLAEDEAGCPKAFMGIEDGSLEMLFVAAEERGKGLGKRLIQYGIENYAVERLAVNEQNPQAKGFYEHMGFRVYKRTELDEQGNPYPLLYMSRTEKSLETM